MMRMRWLITSVALGAAAAGVVCAQSDGTPPPVPPAHEGRADRAGGPGGERMRGEPASARERIERRLEELREESARLEGMLRRMDEGGPESGERGGLPDGPRMRGRGDEPGRERGPMREAFREHVMQFLHAHHPEFAEHLEELRRERPDLADRALSEFGQHMRELGELREKDPVLFKIRLETHRTDWIMRRTVFEAVREARAAGPEGTVDVEGLRAKLAPLVEARFRLSLKERDHSVGELKERIEALHAETERDEAEAPRIVQERLDRLIEHVTKMASGEFRPFEEGRGRPERPGGPSRGGPDGPGGGTPRRGPAEAAPPRSAPPQH